MPSPSALTPPSLPEMPCDPPRIHTTLPEQHQRWILEVLDRIKVGETREPELAPILGEPSERNAETETSFYNYPYFSGEGANVYLDGESVESIALGLPLTVGRLVEAYGPPSSVYRSTTADSAPHSWNRTLLIYGSHGLSAIIEQRLCEIPAGVPIDVLYVDPPAAPTGGALLSAEAVELEWSAVYQQN